MPSRPERWLSRCSTSSAPRPAVLAMIGDDPGIEVARSRAHDHAADRGEAHAGIDAPPRLHGGQARAVAEMRHHHLAVCSRGASDAAKLLQQKRIRQAMKPVAPQTGGVVRLGNRQPPRDVGQIAMERGVEAGDLRHAGTQRLERLDERDFIGQVVGRKRHQPVERVEQRPGHDLRLDIVRSAVHEPVSDRLERPGADIRRRCVRSTARPRHADR